MKKDVIFNLLAEAIENKDFRCIHLTEKDGEENIVVTFDKNFFVFFNQNGTVQVHIRGKNGCVRGIKRETLIELSVEMIEKKRQDEMLAMEQKIEKWKELRNTLDEKIREAIVPEMAEDEPQKLPSTIESYHGTPNKEGVIYSPETKQEKSWFKKIFSKTEG